MVLYMIRKKVSDVELMLGSGICVCCNTEVIFFKQGCLFRDKNKEDISEGREMATISDGNLFSSREKYLNFHLYSMPVAKGH